MRRSKTSDRPGHDAQTQGRRLLWWNMPVSVDTSEEVGRSMLLTSAAWFVSVLGIVLGVALLLA